MDPTFKNITSEFNSNKKPIIIMQRNIKTNDVRIFYENLLINDISNSKDIFFMVLFPGRCIFIEGPDFTDGSFIALLLKALNVDASHALFEFRNKMTNRKKIKVLFDLIDVNDTLDVVKLKMALMSRDVYI